ncbi:uncharacterized protein V6R79_003742 [Siganus canaliculatus]
MIKRLRGSERMISAFVTRTELSVHQSCQRSLTVWEQRDMTHTAMKRKMPSLPSELMLFHSGSQHKAAHFTACFVSPWDAGVLMKSGPRNFRSKYDNEVCNTVAEYLKRFQAYRYFLKSTGETVRHGNSRILLSTLLTHLGMIDGEVILDVTWSKRTKPDVLAARPNALPARRRPLPHIQSVRRRCRKIQQNKAARHIMKWKGNVVRNDLQITTGNINDGENVKLLRQTSAEEHNADSQHTGALVKSSRVPGEREECHSICKARRQNSNAIWLTKRSGCNIELSFAL